MATIHVLVATVEREVYRGDADKVIVPGVAGELGILPKHSPLMAALRPGELRIHRGDEVDEVFVSGGFVEIQPDQITVLADSAERAADIDEAAALEAQRLANERIEKQNGDLDLAAAEAELMMMSARLKWLHSKKK